MEQTKKVSKCSFCEQHSDDAFVRGTQVLCRKCHYIGNIQMENIPSGAVYCFKCKSYSNFKASFADAEVEFSFASVDTEGAPIYIPIGCKGSWDKLSVPTSLECSCGATIPTFVMYMNSWTTPHG